MGKSYTSTIQVACWKEHTCKSCGAAYAYELKRKVSGKAGTADTAVKRAQKAATVAMRDEVDPEPCPACGTVQPDMIGQGRRRWHWRTFWIALAAFALLLILRATDVLNANEATWWIAATCLLAAAFLLAVDVRNPNRDLDGNRQRSMQRAGSGLIRHTPVRGPAAPRGAGAGLTSVAPRSILQMIAALLVVIAVVLAASPELLRAKNAWPVNAACYPPVVGPGDHTRVYMPQKVTSIKGYWRGDPHVLVHGPGLPAEGIDAAASTNQNDWGNTISAKSSEKSTSATPWVEIDMPKNPALAGKTVQCDVDLELQYPQMSGSSSFQTVGDSMHHGVQMVMAPASAGRTYNSWWWEGSTMAIAATLLSALLLVMAARSLQRQAVPAPRVLSSDAPAPPPPPLPGSAMPLPR